MKTLIRVSTILILALFVSSCAKKDTVLHVIQASYGQVVGDREAGYKLILEEIDETVIWFSDRPVRKAGSVHIRDFLKDWDEGANSFKKDPPNAVLIIDNSEPVVVELILVNWNAKATFELKSLKGQEYKIADKRGPVTLFIDAYTVNPQITD